jgi:protein-tyrosine phosphatase
VKYIDLHSHILPGFDDGAQDDAQALRMARMAVADGVECVVATPHSVDGVWVQLPDAVREATTRLQAMCQEQGIDLRIVPGLEAYIAPDLPGRVTREPGCTLGGTRYLLLEFPLQQYPRYVEQTIFELQVAGFVPIIAHPERYTEVIKDPSLIHTLVERGVLTQVTAASLTGAFGREVQETAQMFLAHGLTHVIASDAHGTGPRSPMLSEAVAVAAELVGEDRALAMATETPARILADERVDVAPPEPLQQRKRRRWRFW